jgi:hypothetical protein
MRNLDLAKYMYIVVHKDISSFSETHFKKIDTR